MQSFFMFDALFSEASSTGKSADGLSTNDLLWFTQRRMMVSFSGWFAGPFGGLLCMNRVATVVLIGVQQNEMKIVSVQAFYSNSTFPHAA
jgi:hypothetical protein